MNLAVLACSNGLGHTRRVIAISSFMLKNGFKGNIYGFIPVTHIKALESWDECRYFKSHPLVKIEDFQYPDNASKKTKSIYDKDWSTINLPQLGDFDVVWSDNITQVVEKRPDVILTGSFFWHEVFDNINNKNGLASYIEHQRKLLEKFKPTMAGNEYFSTPEVRQKTNFYPVGLYRYNLDFRQKTNRAILLSCGLGGEEEDMFKNSLEKIIRENLKPPQKLYVEPRLLPDKYPTWIEKADFSSDMFNDCLAVCIRPGMGTISDALVSRNRIFTYSKDDSFEMNYNRRILESLGIGEGCESPFNAYLKAINYVNNIEQINLQILRTSHLRTDGVFATASLILKNCNNRVVI